jgi:adenine C2-methylase RlmN of 23S rRNA A2503 and tRNA A37
MPDATVKIIEYNPIDAASFENPDEEKVVAFMEITIKNNS